MQPYADEAAVDSRVLKQLDHMEKILWVGTPPSAMTLRLSDALFVLGPLGILIMLNVVGGVGIPGFFYLLPVLFFTSVAAAKFERMNTVYALTDRKVIIAGRILGRSERILKLGELLDLKLDERSDGSGTITFGGVWRNSYISDLAPSTDKTPPHVEVGPDAARQVFSRFEEARVAERSRLRS